ncbi:hypothetical protein FQP90_00935 [Paenarthrobacter nitroguajacolicus]|uniref:Uncharacterized protein n=1 Tax=Paenarthrobacter nitroguajacolicus TaxID=211146 RepID=A0A558HC85_PAENT|nr:hypothetical protein [Paenarthrobacter nitroguajacolicus]TVU66740.1 hypothetical protein FQP90_00935 [Paenarthrobacter nitroguajacolicus]
MITHFYPTALRIITCIVAVCSAVSATLLGTAPPPQGLVVLDPTDLRTTAVVLTISLGVVAPVAVLIADPLRCLLLKAAVFAASGFGNAMMLSPLLVVPFQETPTLLAVICSLALTVASIVAYMESVERKNARRRANT